MPGEENVCTVRTPAQVPYDVDSSENGADLHYHSYDAARTHSSYPPAREVGINRPRWTSFPSKSAPSLADWVLERPLASGPGGTRPTCNQSQSASGKRVHFDRFHGPWFSAQPPLSIRRFVDKATRC
ncbi:hypothetical protein M404DRAFT_22022 [Pisolithus tinctorius Marx 270]|uniref:Uncharacterized protein n=1 Tax=Pisolithus tinctorius Marx 270 TaxID=870435 RepID=A0A0C3KIV9_PISTI|nr:hypothetical protein M404DRAFT_22022 [Pisolithus tinctorius Marx 270]